MPVADNSEHLRTAVQKASDLTLTYLTSSNGVMDPKRAKEFMVIARKEGKILPMTDLKFQMEESEKIDKVSFSDRILRDADHGVALPSGSRTRPAFSQVSISTELYRGECHVEEAVFEDNLTEAAFERLVRNEIAKKAGEEMEEYLINSDTTSSDVEYAKQNGILKQATSYTVDAGTSTITDEWLTKTRTALPIEFRKDSTKMKMFTSPNVVENYKSWFKNRISAMADALITSGGNVKNDGKMLIEVPYWPENYGGSDLSAVLYCDPKNIAVRVHRKLKLRVATDIQAENVVFVISLRYGFKFRHEPAVTKLYNVTVDA